MVVSTGLYEMDPLPPKLAGSNDMLHYHLSCRVWLQEMVLQLPWFNGLCNDLIIIPQKNVICLKDCYYHWSIRQQLAPNPCMERISVPKAGFKDIKPALSWYISLYELCKQ